MGRRVHTGLCALGLACWVVTLTLHSPTVTPFQRFGGLSGFVGTFAPRSLGIAAAVAAVLALAALRGHALPGGVLRCAGGVLYVLTGVGFAVCSLRGVGNASSAVIWLFSLVGALGSVAMGLVWGRVFKGLSPRSSLAAVGLSGVVAAALGTGIAYLPMAPSVALFVLCVLVAVVLPSTCGMASPDADADLPGVAAGVPRRSTAERLRSFVDVAAPALIGLLAFAFVVGTMRALVIQTHPFHLVSLALDGAVLVAFALGRVKRPLVGLIYRNLIPALGVLLLAVANISQALFAGSSANMVMIYLLYTLAALLTLATLAAVAHAGEFPADFVYGAPFALFCLASFVGLRSAEVMNEEAISVSTTVITTVYAFAMVIVPGIKAQRLAQTEPDLFLDENPSKDEAVLGPQMPTAGSLGDPVAPTPQERCDELVRAHRLTAREAEILNYLAAGYGSGYISDALYISPNTVRTHIHNIYGKLGVNSREDVLDLVKGGGR